jgi:multidrug efflux pump subunit AcrA (membrane-fusion protein)
MASTFFRSVRSLEADNSQRSYLGLALAALLLGAWMVWFFLARVSVYAVTNKAELEVDRAAHSVQSAVSGRVVATHLVLDQEVKAGDVLVELDSGAQHFQLTEEKTQLAGANPQIHSRLEEIASEEQALEQDQQSAKDALEEARAHYREAEAAAQFAQAESERLRKMYNAGVANARGLRSSRKTTRAFDSTGRRRIYTKPESDGRALGTVFQNSNIETIGRPSLSLPTTTAIRIASASLHKDRHPQATVSNCESKDFKFAAAHSSQAKRALKRSLRKSGDRLPREVVQVDAPPSTTGLR